MANIFEKNKNTNKMENEKEKCKMCGKEEVPANSPRTVYECGSSDYDQRPDTFIQSEKCKDFCNEKK
jgi:hypothetical protein